MMTSNAIDPLLSLDWEEEVQKISLFMRNTLRSELHRRGYIIAISGGIDSSVCAALAVQAVGAKKIFGLLLPESDSSSDSNKQGKQLAEHLGIPYKIENITNALQAVGCYQWRDEAIKKVFPDYGSDWKNKITISNTLEGQINHFSLTVENPQGEQFIEILGIKEYLTIVAATNYKQRIRKTIEYFHADRLNYAVIGTPNRLEYDQGFFVKSGDGAADIKPIAHLYKTQVYALAKHLQLPEEICNAIPGTDTYSLQQGQDEFYFSLPYAQMDIALYYKNKGYESSVLAEKLSISKQQADYIYNDITKKRATTQYQHAAPYLIKEVL